MRRHLLIPLILFLAAGLLAACGTDDPMAGTDDHMAGTESSMAGSDDHMAGTESSMAGSDDRMAGSDDHMAGGHGDPSPVAEGAREIPVTADGFAFDPDEITVRAGEDVAIVLTSVDIIHDFTIDELGAHVAADRGETASGGLRADDPGRYTFYCAVAGHREAGMEGTLVVEG